MKFNIKILNETRAFQKNLEKAANKIMPNLTKARDLVGNLIQSESRRTITEQMMDGPDISASWRAWKAQRGFDTRRLLCAHIMVNMIRYKRYSTSPAAISGGVTVLDRTYPDISRLLKRPRAKRILTGRQASGMTTHKSKGTSRGAVSVRTIAMYHEGGLGGRIKRSFFKPTYLRENQKVLDHFISAINDALSPIL